MPVFLQLFFWLARMNCIGIDSVLLTQKKERRLRKSIVSKGLLGLGVEVNDLPGFKVEYKNAMRKIFEKNNREYKRPVYCAHDLTSVFGFETIDSEYALLHEFKELILPKIEKIHFFYTYIFGLKDNLVSIYGKSPAYAKIPLLSLEKEVQDFYDLISNSYPMLCAWELKNYDISAKLFLDNFQGRGSPAWSQLTGAADISVYYKGDQCHELISAADLLLKLAKIKMLPNISCFLESEIQKTGALFGDKFRPYFIGKRCLNQITPDSPAQIRHEHLAKHPIYYIIKENPKEENEETTIIENSPVFDKMIKEIASLDGCFKYFHPDDSRLIKQGDKIVAFGDRGEKKFKELEKLEYPIKKFS